MNGASSQSAPDLAAARRSFLAGEMERGALRDQCCLAGRHVRAVQRALRESAIKEVLLTRDDIIAHFETGLRFYWEVEAFGDCVNISFSQGAYEPDELALMQTLAQGKSVFLDVGANIGWYALNLAGVLDSDSARVFAFEPVPELADALTRNIALNGLEAVIEPVRAGVAEAPGRADFMVPTAVPSAASMMALHPHLEQTRLSCPLVSLDHFVTERGVSRVDLIKGDVEGGELKLVLGALNVISRDRPVLMLELLRKWSQVFGYHPDDVLRTLAEFGYACWATGKGPPRRIEAVLEETEETNFIFLAQHHEREAAVLGALAS